MIMTLGNTVLPSDRKEMLMAALKCIGSVQSERGVVRTSLRCARNGIIEKRLLLFIAVGKLRKMNATARIAKDVSNTVNEENCRTKSGSVEQNSRSVDDRYENRKKVRNVRRMVSLGGRDWRQFE